MVRSLIALFFLLFPLSAYAQGGNVFFGYSYMRAGALEGSPGPTANLNGWNGSLEGKVFPHVGIVADISGQYGKQGVPTFCPVQVGLPCTPFNPSTRRYTFVFGPRVSFSVGKIRPFAHYLVGAGHVSLSGDTSGSDTSLAQTIGGGIDYKLIPLVAWRFQGDYVQTRFFDSRQNNFRLSTGIVLHF